MSQTVWPNVDGAADPQLQRALEQLEAARDVELDFAPVPRIEPTTLRALEQLASKASQKSARIVVRGLNVQAYKVLKLARMAAQFSFQN